MKNKREKTVEDGRGLWHDHTRNDTEKLSIRFWSYGIIDMQSTPQPTREEKF